MQMNGNTNGKYQQLYPKTLSGNVTFNNGQTLEQWKYDVEDIMNDTREPLYTILWEGRAILGSGERIDIDKKLTECKNGWILLFKQTGYSHNYNYQYVPKVHPYVTESEKATKFVLGAQGGAFVQKYIFIQDNYIEGFRTNSSGGNENQELIRIIAY